VKYRGETDEIRCDGGYIPSNGPFDIHGNNTCPNSILYDHGPFSVNFHECNSDRPYRFTLRARLQGDL